MGGLRKAAVAKPAFSAGQTTVETDEAGSSTDEAGGATTEAQYSELGRL